MRDSAFVLCGINIIAVVVETQFESRFDHITLHSVVALSCLFLLRYAARKVTP